MTAPLRALTWQQLLDAQCGVLAREQALATGMTAHAWDWRRSRGGWRALLPGVAVSHAGAVTDDEVRWAAVLHAGAGAAVTADWALAQHGFRCAHLPDVVRVAVPEGRRVRTAALVTPDRALTVVSHSVRGLDVLRHPARRPPVVTLPIAALHAAAHAASDRAAEWRLAAVVQQRLTTPTRLLDAITGLPRLHRRALMSDVLADVAVGVSAQSELDLVRLLRREGLPLPDRLQRLVRADGKRYLDAWWEARRVAAEVDGAHHVEVGQWDADTLRANAVVLEEQHDRLLLLRFTTGNLRHDEPDVVGQLRRALVAEP